MMRIILKSIKMAPRLLCQMYIQPSQVYDFVKKGKDNVYLCTWGFFFAGLFIGIIAALPHYFLYGDIYRSLLFTFTSAAIFAFVVILKFSSLLPSEDFTEFLLHGKGAIEFLGRFLVVMVFAFFFLFSLMIVLTVSIAFLVAVILLTSKALESVSAAEKVNIEGVLTKILNQKEIIIIILGMFILLLLWMIFYRAFKGKIISYSKFIPFIFIFHLIFFIFVLLRQKSEIKSYEAILFPFSFFLWYMFAFHFSFIEITRAIKKNGKFKKGKARNILRRNYGKIQKSSLIWSPLVTLLLYIYVGIVKKIEINTGFHIIALGFMVIPLFISHVPDYLLYLPAWLRLRRKIMQDHGNARESIREYENAYLFKHELLLFPLPGLYKIPVFFAGNREIGMREAAKRIVHLYQFTFQQKQARKAAVKLLEDKARAHGLVLTLLELDGVDLLENIARAHPLADIYHWLLVEIEPGEPGKVKDNWHNKIMLQSHASLVHAVSREMSEQEGYGFNEEMVASLEALHILLTAESIKDIDRAVGQLEEIKTFPDEITYFTLIRGFVPGLKKIKDSLDKIEDVERLESRRSFLNDQKQQCEALILEVEQTFFQPFKSIWVSGLKQCIEVISREITLLKGSALVTIRLKNSEITASPAEQRLYFEIGNTGQELAEDISVTLETEVPGVSFIAETGVKINVIETNSVKEISIPIIAPAEGKTTLKGVLTFSDRARSGKTLDFSFPLTILKRAGNLKK